MKNIHLRCGRAFVSLLCECLAIHDVKAFSLLLAARQNPNIYDNWLKGVFFCQQCAWKLAADFYPILQNDYFNNVAIGRSGKKFP